MNFAKFDAATALSRACSEAAHTAPADMAFAMYDIIRALDALESSPSRGSRFLLTMTEASVESVMLRCRVLRYNDPVFFEVGSLCVSTLERIRADLYGRHIDKRERIHA